MAANSLRHAFRCAVVAVRAAVLTLVLLPGAWPVAAASHSHAERMYARALDSFRQGRFPDAYGRFSTLANAGHPASALYALWMCDQGLPLFGRDWDCAPHEVEAWLRAAGPMAPRAAVWCVGRAGASDTSPVRAACSARTDLFPPSRSSAR